MNESINFFEKLISRKKVFDKSFSVYVDEIELPSGERAQRALVDFPQASAVVPFVDDDHVVMVEQYRYPFDRLFLEIPAGKTDPGEDPLDCAKRELLEETGFQASHYDLLISFAPAISYSNEIIHVYVATGLKKVGSTNLDYDEQLSVKIVNFDDILEQILFKKEIKDAKTIIGLMLAKKWKEERK